MEIDVMTGGSTWAGSAELAKNLQDEGFAGMLYTETSQVPWMQIAAAAMAAPDLYFTTGIAVAFPRSPMVSAAIAYELADNTEGRFRLGLGSQVKAHVVRRYGSEFDRPAARMRDYVAAVKACWRAFNREERLSHEGDFYNLSLLPPAWSPRSHDHQMKVDISAVGPVMTRVAGEVADGVHVHPLHSMHYIEKRLLPGVAEGASKAGRSAEDIDLIIPVFACPGDTPEERAPYVETTKQQIAFYGSTPNYAFQFDDLGFEGTTARIREKMKAGELDTMGELITDEMLDHFALSAPWDEMADRLLERYASRATRVVMYLGEQQIRNDPDQRSKWGEIARAVRNG
ncbi:MAG: TIGR03617 family F420-dependent LLM class oxidoreductase [Actinomycetia bacterium]|nr:TIGR03617 family F420-dependent LLM class oxidoreductase [Actinomycetes bacterium]MCP4959860.1 TIGR03617 family F420-dependent LLM class oxidoreductase [Actinomycetes bacterium]